MRASATMLATMCCLSACGMPPGVVPMAMQGSYRAVATSDARSRQADRAAAEQAMAEERARRQHEEAVAARAKIAADRAEREQRREAALARQEQERQERQERQRIEQEERAKREELSRETKRLATATEVKVGMKRDDLIGQFVRIAAQVARTDEQGAYFEFTETAEVCLRESANHPHYPIRWGRGKRGGYRSGGYRSGWSEWRSRTRSHTVRGSRSYVVVDSPEPEARVTVRPAVASLTAKTKQVPRPKCRQVTTSLMLRLSQPDGVVMEPGDYVRIYGTALPTMDATLVIANPTIKLISRGEQVLLGALD